MASTLSKEVLPFESITATKTGAPIDLFAGDVNFIGQILVTNASSANYAVIIQHSHDKINWLTLLSFTAVTANVHEIIQVNNTNVHVMTFVRAVLTRTAGSADFVIDLLHDRK